MFYNNDILARRKTGLGLVWLAATLGHHSIIHRLTRKEILSVDISKSCASVIRPSEPLALRLSSQLMYGLVKLYNHQTELLYQDTVHVQSDVRRHTSTVVGIRKDIDMRKHAVGRQGITLPLDLAFFTLDFDAALSGVLYRLSEEPQVRRVGVIGDGFRQVTPVRFVEEEERITLPGRRELEEQEEELGFPRGFEGEEMRPLVFGQGEYEEEQEGFEGLDLGLEPLTAPEPFPPGVASEEIQRRRQAGEETIPTMARLVEWPELEERLAEEASRLPIVEGVPTVTPLRRRREEEEEEEAQEVEAMLGLPQRRPRIIPLPREDRDTELSEAQLRSARADYPSRMATLRAAQRRRSDLRAAESTVRRMIFSPPQDLALNPMLSDMWQITVGADMLSRRARYRAMQREAAHSPVEEAPPTPPPPTPIDLEDLVEVGVARAAAEAEIPAALRGAEGLPWNLFMEHRRRSSMLPSISYERPPTFEREMTPLRLRELSVETPTGLGRIPPESPLLPYAPGTPSTVAPLEETFLPPGTPSVERLRLGLPEAVPFSAERMVEKSPTPPAQIFEHEIQEETRNFFQYAKSIRDELEDPNFLFFSDLAPVASSTPAVAAQAFYHTLALASMGRLRVKQDEAYQQIRISLIA
ncbi:related to meiotic recombination protein rec8 [Melanopsichium pennsylvanicum]|uniref:Related to meiotic recombination protein rec8 n=2 Tax=Melanopsichium pennsylvanicum TaxID=63383 RepID=A0AAJ5C2J7_9BASI|nr:related to meiotic recombination protein rec8 [Melanopsichium pennsylvanicum 4]SNX81494.1 related to meiotic recombination protein rec8 [Melanopsichium pennsylvanicum]